MKNFLLAYLFIFLFWILFVPAFEFPDEQAHFATVALWSEQGRMPSGQVADVSQELSHTEEVLGTLRDPRGNNKYTYHPENKHEFSSGLYGPREQEILDANTTSRRSTTVFKEAARYPFLYYAYAGLFYKSVFDGHIFDRLVAVRFGSIVLCLLNIWVAYKIGREIWPKNNFGYIVAALVALQPMMTFVMSSINSDVLHNLLFSCLILFSLRIIKYDHIGDSLFYITVIIFLDILTKPQAYIALPIVITAFILRAVYRHEILGTIKKLFILTIVGLAVGVSTKNPQIVAFVQTGKIPFINSTIHPEAPIFAEYARYSLDRLIHQNIVWYWGVFKWLGVVLPKPFWWLANRLVLISIVGLIIGFIKNFDKDQKIKLGFLILASTLYMFAIFYYDWTYIRAHAVQVAVQARYYFPLFTAHMAILLAGILGYSKNQTYQSLAAKFVFAFFIILQFAGIFTIAKSYYDISSFQTLFIQASQYKPIYAKGIMWWIWGSLYLVGLGGLSYKIFAKN